MIGKQDCTGCGACAAVCPCHAVRMEADREGFFYPRVEEAACTDCGRCIQVCPAEGSGTAASNPACFGAKARREEPRRLGASGGLFPLLAAQVLREGGTVWGAALLEDGTVRHIAIRDEEEIARLAMTKYVQSDMGLVWEHLGASLARGRPVLFCGTPCQTDAVRSVVGPERGGLILADLICYGVPSPDIWRRYVRYLSRRYDGAFRSFSFRDKRNRDHGHTCAARIGEREYTWPLSRDLYCRTMFQNVNLRPSCFRCRYCTTARSSDITLGDFWGIDQIRPGFDDGMGCSAVLCHTGTGRRLWERVKPEVQWFICGEDDIANESQPRLREPVRSHPRRGLYLELLRWMPDALWFRLFR